MRLVKPGLMKSDFCPVAFILSIRCCLRFYWNIIIMIDLLDESSQWGVLISQARGEQTCRPVEHSLLEGSRCARHVGLPIVS